MARLLLNNKVFLNETGGVVTLDSEAGGPPGTILNIVLPEVTVAAVGTTPPPSIPLNSLTPTTFDQTPTLVTVSDISNSGSLNTSTCF